MSGNNVVFGLVLVVLTTIVNQIFDFAGIGFYEKIVNEVVTKLEKDKKYLTTSQVEQVVSKSLDNLELTKEKIQESVNETAELKLEKHLRSTAHVQEVETSMTELEEPLSVAMYWGKVGSPAKGQLLLNGNSEAVRKHTEYGHTYLVSVGDHRAKAMRVVYGDLVTASGSNDAVGRMHIRDFEDLFGGAEVGMGFVNINRMNGVKY